MEIRELQQAVGYEFQDLTLLDRALTHSSYVNESRQCVSSNERLEFLGDSVLGFICAKLLFLENRKFDEGDLSKLRAALVCEASLAKFAREIKLGEYMHFSRSEEQSGGKDRPSILADAFEALVLECSFIKQYSPKYNILLKDDKGYHYIRVGPGEYGKITASHQPLKDGARYLGPYISGYVVKQTVDEV